MYLKHKHVTGHVTGHVFGHVFGQTLYLTRDLTTITALYECTETSPGPA